MRRGINKGLVAGLLAAVTVAACAPMNIPMTRDGFKSQMAGAGSESFVVNASLDTVSQRLTSKSQCLNVKRTSRMTQGGITRMETSTIYSARMRKVKQSQLEYTLQMDMLPPPVNAKPPTGGYYVLASDLVAAGPGRTKVVLYGAKTGPYAVTTEAIKAWMHGREAECPVK